MSAALAIPRDYVDEEEAYRHAEALRQASEHLKNATTVEVTDNYFDLQELLDTLTTKTLAEVDLKARQLAVSVRADMIMRGDL